MSDRTITLDLTRCLSTPIALYVAVRICGWRVVTIDVVVNGRRSDV